MKKYIVCYVLRNPEDGGPGLTDYDVFVDPEADNRADARKVYDEYTNDEKFYSVNLTEIIDSTDY